MDATVNSVIITGEQCFEVEIGTVPTQEVSVEADMEGEYQNDVFILMETIGNTLRIGTDFTPNFEQPNDKLSAHKVLSVRLKILLPEHLRVSLVAGDCQVSTTGNYRELDVKIAGGGCTLKHKAEKTAVNTISGFITAEISSGQANVYSGYGEVNLGPIPRGNAQYDLKSVRGAIRVNSKY